MIKSEQITSKFNKKSPFYELEERTFRFAKDVGLFIRRIPRSIENIEYCRQLARASGSPGANYREANESLGKKDFLMRIKICKKEAKESVYWLRLLNLYEDELIKECDRLIKEAIELMNIFGAIQRNSS